MPIVQNGYSRALAYIITARFRQQRRPHEQEAILYVEVQ